MNKYGAAPELFQFIKDPGGCVHQMYYGGSHIHEAPAVLQGRLAVMPEAYAPFIGIFPDMP
jgi:hypothetical protein